MTGRIISFVIWSAIGCIFVCLSIYSYFSKKPARFWANADIFEISDIKKYNHAMAKLFCIFGIVLIVLGIPLLAGQNSAWILLSVVGLMIESIVAMAVYSLVIEKSIKSQDELLDANLKWSERFYLNLISVVSLKNQYNLRNGLSRN